MRHAFLAPSAADRWGPGRCPASPRLEEMYPQAEESPESIEGTAAHWYAFKTLTTGVPPEVGSFAPNGFAITQEIVDDTQEYIAAIRSEGVFGDDRGLENRVSMSKSVHPNNWGTPDRYLLDRTARILRIRDFKFGHRYVDEFENWQVVDYAIGVFETHGFNLFDVAGWIVELVLHQPRYYGPQGQVRTYTMKGEELYAKSLLLREAAVAAHDPQAPCKTGSWCLDCSARHACTALQTVGGICVDLSMSAQPIDLTPEALGQELSLIASAEQRLKARRTGLEAQAMSILKSGTAIVPGWTLEPSGARSRWTKPVPEIITMGALCGVELAAPQSVITPAQARKAGLPGDIVAAFSETPRGAPKLVPLDARTIAKKLK